MTKPQTAMAQEKAEAVILREFINTKLTIRRNGGHSLVVLGPPAQEMPPDVVVEGEGDRDSGPNVRQV